MEGNLYINPFFYNNHLQILKKVFYQVNPNVTVVLPFFRKKNVVSFFIIKPDSRYEHSHRNWHGIKKK